MNLTTSLTSLPPAAKPKLDRKIGIVNGFLLILWGVFTVGIQVYIFAAYSKNIGDGDRGKVWTDAYNGMAMASGAVNIFIGGVNMAVFSSKHNSRGRLALLLCITTLGALGAVASLVLTAMESDILNYPRHMGSGHPCENKANTLTDKPTTQQCTEWLALELTVSVLSGLAFCSYFILIYQVTLGLAMAASQQPKPKRANVEPKTKPPTENYYTASRPPSEAFMDTSGPYQAFGDKSDDLNPKYQYHLQQISLQQRAIDDMLASKRLNPRQSNGAVPSTPVILSSSVSMSSKRGQMHYANQEHYYPQYKTNTLVSSTKAAKPVPIPMPPQQTTNNLPPYISDRY